MRKLNLNAWAVSVLSKSKIAFFGSELTWVAHVDSPLLRVATKPFQTLFEYIRLLITVSDDVVRLESILWHFWASFDTDEVLEFFCEGGHAEVAFIK